MSYAEATYASEDFLPLFALGERVVLITNPTREYTVARVFRGDEFHYSKYHLRREDGTLLKYVVENDVDFPF